MFSADKCVTTQRYPNGRVIFASIVALLGLISSAQAAIPAINPPPPVMSPASATADNFGPVLSIAELAAASGKGLFVVAETNALVSLLNDVDRSGNASGQQRMVASNGRAAVPTTRLQLAALDGFSSTSELSNRLLQTQSAAGGSFDASLHYLCSDKIYSDFYPTGTGWNNHTYARGCDPGGTLDPERPNRMLTNVPVPTLPPPGDPGGFVIIPCGGSIANVSSMTIGPSVTGPTLASAMPNIQSLSSFTSLLGRGHR
jgi:hypothetical protein